ncbi:MAG: SMP-30/gluconolactonase/LRE family protein [Proteobacteria bacterium]|nr:SMP-30/gluconolactonase/LRE family protein [Pseudomonadota bacterium]MCH8262176.1 SMP-30/gluconolactonase/LRE family protein [Pseudomonadota bacterium]
MEKLISTLLIFTVLILSACSDNAQTPQVITAETAENNSPEKGTAKLELLWEAQGFNNPESVIYHESSNTLFVSNVNGSPIEKDGNGYISKILLDGTILKMQWVIGLNAPKGLAIHDNTLYVSDIDTLVAIDIPSGTITNTYKVDDAKFLNDVTASNQGEIFVSDMLLNRIYRLSNDQFNLWLESTELENPNGLHAEGDHLILGAWGVITDGFATEIPGHLKSISLQDKSITSLGGDPIGNLDGVESDGNNGYYVTDWMAGKLFQINTNGEATLLLELEQGMADHEVLLEQNLILLPMMKNDKVLAYRIK